MMAPMIILESVLIVMRLGFLNNLNCYKFKVKLVMDIQIVIVFLVKMIEI